MAKAKAKDVVTVRMNPQQHAALFKKALKLGCSMNNLCLALLSQPLLPATPLTVKQVKLAGEFEVVSTTPEVEESPTQ